MDRENTASAAESRLISDCELRDNIIKAYAEIDKATAAFEKGMLAKDDLYSRVSDILNKRFSEFLTSRNVRCVFTQNSQIRFTEDYLSWLSGGKPQSGAGQPWLCRLKTENENARCDELSVPDKEAFFELMTAFDVPAEYFKPLAEDAVSDERKAGELTGTGELTWNIYSRWRDNDGMLHDSSPEGKTFSFTSDLGLKAVVSITGKRECCGLPMYMGEGTIEGYTSKQKRKIEIFAGQDGKISSLAYLSLPEDEQVYLSFPMWEKQIEFTRYKNGIRRKAVDTLTQHFLYIRSAK